MSAWTGVLWSYFLVDRRMNPNKAGWEIPCKWRWVFLKTFHAFLLSLYRCPVDQNTSTAVQSLLMIALEILWICRPSSRLPRERWRLAGVNTDEMTSEGHFSWRFDSIDSCGPWIPGPIFDGLFFPIHQRNWVGTWIFWDSQSSPVRSWVANKALVIIHEVGMLIVEAFRINHVVMRCHPVVYGACHRIVIGYHSLHLWMPSTHWETILCNPHISRSSKNGGTKSEVCHHWAYNITTTANIYWIIDIYWIYCISKMIHERISRPIILLQYIYIYTYREREIGR